MSQIPERLTYDRTKLLKTPAPYSEVKSNDSINLELELDSGNSSEYGNQNSRIYMTVSMRTPECFCSEILPKTTIFGCFLSQSDAEPQQFSPAALSLLFSLRSPGFEQISLTSPGSEDTPPPPPLPQSNIHEFLAL